MMPAAVSGQGVSKREMVEAEQHAAYCSFILSLGMAESQVQIVLAVLNGHLSTISVRISFGIWHSSSLWVESRVRRNNLQRQFTKLIHNIKAMQ